MNSKILFALVQNMVSIDDKTAYDMVSQTWIVECLKMYKIPTKS